MQKDIVTVSRLKTIRNIFKFLENPIPLINDMMTEVDNTSYRVHLGGLNKSMMTMNPVIIQHVLQKNHRNYFKSELQTKHVAKYVGNGLLTTNGDYWLRQRRLIQPGFHKKKLEKLVLIVDEVVKEYIQNLHERIQSGETSFSIDHDMHELTLKIVSKSLFSSGITNEQLEILGEGITQLQLAVIKDVRQPVFGWYRKLIGETKRNKILAEKVYKLLNDLIEERRKSNEVYDDLLDMLLSSRYEDTGEGMSNQQILDEALIFFVAGHETSANALTWTLYLLDQNKEHITSLREEIANSSYGKDPSFENVMQLGFHKQIISESLRLYPPAWITDRVALDDDEVEGIKISKGEIMGIYIYGTHRSKYLWEDPDTFNPDRFSKENSKLIKPFSYFPFGGGPRLCIGQQFAMMEMIQALHHLLDNFSFTLDPHQKIDIQPLITLRPKYGMKMNVKSLK